MEQDERQVQIGAGDITLLDASRPDVRFTGRSLLNRFHYFYHALCWNNIFPIKTCLRRKTGR